MDSDLSGGWRYPPFEQLEPEKFSWLERIYITKSNVFFFCLSPDKLYIVFRRSVSWFDKTDQISGFTSYRQIATVSLEDNPRH